MTADLETAAAATAWPVLDPPLEEVVAQGPPPGETRAGCGHSDPAHDASLCTFGPIDAPTMYVLGDSTAIALIETLRGAYGEQYRIRGLTMASCQFPVRKAYAIAELRDECAAHVANSLQAVVEDEPDVVVLSDVYDIADRLASRAEGEAAVEEWRQGLQAVVDRISDAAGQVVVVSPPVHGLSLEECATSGSTPQDCTGTIPADYQIGHAAESGVRGTGVHYLDAVGWFCTPEGRCPPFVGNTPLRRDTVHPSLTWSRKIAPLLRDRVDSWLPRPTDS